MVQFFRGGPSRSALWAQMLGPSLGEGLGNFLGNYQVNKALDQLVNNPEYKNKNQAERMEALQSTLGRYGERGQKAFQTRLGIEQQSLQDARNKAENKFLSGGELTEREQELVRPELRVSAAKAQGKKTQSAQPIDPDQLQKIQDVRKIPGFDDMSETQQYRAFTDAGVSRENAIAEASLGGKEKERTGKEQQTSYEQQKSFIEDVTNSYKGFEQEMKPRLLQMQKLTSDDDLIGPTAAVFLEQLGIPLGALEDPSSELFDKLSQDLLKGLPETYGSRILKVEVDNFLKTIPRLMNSADGRRMIASNMLKLGEMKEVYYKEMRQQQKDILDSNKKFPSDFQQRVFDNVKPQIDRINNEFVKLSEIKSVPKGTTPYFDPDGNIVFVEKQHEDWANKNGGRKIW